MKHAILFLLLSAAVFAQTEPTLWQQELDIGTDFSGDSLKVFELPPRFLPERIRVTLADCSGFDSLYIGIRGDERGGTKPHRFASIWTGRQHNDTLRVIYRAPLYGMTGAFGKYWTHNEGIIAAITAEVWSPLTGFGNTLDSVAVASGDSIQLPLYGDGIWQLSYAFSLQSDVANEVLYGNLYVGGTPCTCMWMSDEAPKANTDISAGRSGILRPASGGDYVSLWVSGDDDATFTIDQAVVSVSIYSLDESHYDLQRDLCLYLVGNVSTPSGTIIISME